MTEPRPQPTAVLLLPREAADMLRISPHTLARWASRGQIDHLRTPGGRARYPRPAVAACLRGESAGRYRLLPDGPDLLTTAELGRLFRVDVGSVSRWTLGGHLAALTTPNGHLRYPRATVQAFIDQALVTAAPHG